MSNWLDFGWSRWLQLRVDSIGDFVFFRLIMSYLRKEIQDFGLGIMHNAMTWAGGIALTLLTLWIMIQGYRIVTGQSRDSMMLLVTNSLRATLIVGAATTMAAFGTNLHDFLTNDVNREINWVVTGDDSLPEDRIDKNLGWMQVALSSIDALDVVSDPTLDDDKTRAMWFVGLGTGGPALVGGTMLLLYQIALALFVGLGPIFILCLLFDQTKSLFGRWLQYGLGTMFSMAVLSAMVSISLEMVARVAAAFWASAAAGALLGQEDGMTSQAMQQGGMGLILTTLIVSAPPMAAMFFQGTLGQFSAYNAFANQGNRQVPGLPQGQSSSYTYSGPPQVQRDVSAPDASGGNPVRHMISGTTSSAQPTQDAIKAGPRDR
ncbi:type IV secretion system protein [Lysobacter tyrosinilyticus]